MLSRFHLIPERYGRTDRQTDGRMDRQTNRFAISILRVSMLTRDNNNKTIQTDKQICYINTARQYADTR